MCMTHAVSLECTRTISSVSSLLSLAPLVSTISLHFCFSFSHKHFRPSHHHGWGHAAGRQAFQGQAGVSGGQQPSSWQDCKYTFSYFCMCVFASYLMLSLALFLTSLFVSLSLEQVLSVCAHHTLKLPYPLPPPISHASLLFPCSCFSFPVFPYLTPTQIYIRAATQPRSHIRERSMRGLILYLTSSTLKRAEANCTNARVCREDLRPARLLSNDEQLVHSTADLPWPHSTWEGISVDN